MTTSRLPIDRGSFDPQLWNRDDTRRFVTTVGQIFRRYFRSEVTGMDKLPSGGGMLLVSNHSGGMLTPDVMLVGSAYYRHFGFHDRPLYVLAHSAVFAAPFASQLQRIGAVHASRENAVAALRSGGVVLVFPGGEHDCYRPTSADHTIDFNDRRGYVRVALEAEVPIVPVVSIGAQQSHLFISRGTSVAKALGLNKVRLGILPLTFGFPFGFTLLGPPNVPLPTKIVTHVLEPIDVRKRFGARPTVEDVDRGVRETMQNEMGEMARARRFPIWG